MQLQIKDGRIGQDLKINRIRRITGQCETARKVV